MSGKALTYSGDEQGQASTVRQASVPPAFRCVLIKVMGFGEEWGEPLSSSVSLGRSLSLSEPWFPFCEMEPIMLPQAVRR